MSENPHCKLLMDETSGQLVKNQQWEDCEAGYKAGFVDAMKLPCPVPAGKAEPQERCSGCGQPRTAPRLAGCPRGEHYGTAQRRQIMKFWAVWIEGSSGAISQHRSLEEARADAEWLAKLPSCLGSTVFLVEAVAYYQADKWENIPEIEKPKPDYRAFTTAGSPADPGGFTTGS